MQMTKKEVIELLKRYEAGECSFIEEAFLDKAYIDMAMAEDMPPRLPDYHKVKRNVFAKLPTQGKKLYRIPSIIRYAAAVILLGGAIWAYTIFQHEGEDAPAAIPGITEATQIKPGSNKAILTIAGGKQIALSQSKTGVIINNSQITYSDGTNVDKSLSPSGRDAAGGEPSPLVRSGRERGVIQTLTATTPRGGQYQFVLPDGTKVFLNAESEISFPSTFNSNTRSVSLKGEGYFEVTKNPGKPFIVTVTGQQQVKVLGTRFNITAYPNESIKTTLAEGSVQLTGLSSNHPSKVIAKNQPVILKPDQQATLLSTGFGVKQVRAKNQIAWKDGLFVFRQTPLSEALTQIARWYNIPVDVQHIPSISINADISKTQALSELLAVLKEGTGINIVFTKERGLFFEH